jgi:PEGA domain
LKMMGNPEREIRFDQRQWMIYPGFVAALKDNKLETFETSGTGATKITVQSDPPGAEIYLDEQFVGSTPSILSVAPGKHAFRLHAAGRADWSRQINVLTGSDVTLAATLDKN